MLNSSLIKSIKKEKSKLKKNPNSTPGAEGISSKKCVSIRNKGKAQQILQI